jgi:putative thioredoxin
MIPETNVFDVSEASFHRDVIEQSYTTPVVVDFWAPWCGPCRLLGPILERLAQEAGSGFVLAKLNVDDNPTLAAEYGVQGIPAVKAFHRGEVVDGFVGALPEARVRAFLSRIAPSEADDLLATVNGLLADHAWSEAEERLRSAPNTPEVALSRARALLGQGKGCAAAAILEELDAASVYARVERLQPLARFLCESDGGEKPSTNGERDAIEGQYRHSAALLARGNLASALDGLLEVLRADKRYDDGLAKEAILGIFALVGDEDPLTQSYRPELASVLF